MGEGKKERFFYLLGYCANGCKGQGSARLKPGARCSVDISHMGDRDPTLGPIFHRFLSCISRELVWKLSNQNSDWHSDMAPCCQHTIFYIPLYFLSSS